MATDPAEAGLRQKLDQARAAGAKDVIAVACFELAAICRRRGDRREAVALYVEASKLFHEMGSIRSLHSTMNNLAADLMELGASAAAVQNAQYALKLAEQIHDRGLQSMSLNTLGATASYAGDYDAATSAYRQSEAFAREDGDALRTARALYNQSWMAFLAADYDTARSLQESAGVALGRERDARVQGYIAMMGGRLDIRDGDFERAGRRLAWSEAAFTVARDADGAGLALFAFGVAGYLAGSQAGGRERIERSLGMIGIARNRAHTARRLVGLARLEATRGADGDARRFGRLAAGIAEALSDGAVVDMAKHVIEHPAGGGEANGADPGELAVRAAVLELQRSDGQAAPAAAAGAAADLAWLARPPDAPPEIPPSPDVPEDERAMHVGPIRLLDLTAQGFGWSILFDAATPMGLDEQQEAEDRLRALLRRVDPRLQDRLEFDTEAGGVGVVARDEADIRAAAAWLASMLPSR